MKRRLSIGIVLTTASLVIRGVFLLLSNNYGLLKILITDSIKDDTWAYPIFSILWYGFEDIVPITAQIVSIHLLFKPSLSFVSFRKIIFYVISL